MISLTQGTNRALSRKAGRPKGTPNPVKPLDLDQAVDVAAERILTGKKICAIKTPMPLERISAERLERALGVSMEVFNQRLSEKLAIISDKIAQRIEEKVDGDEFKPGELGFIFSVSEDKRRALDARAQLGSAHVNIQVNNYGERTREDIMAELRRPFELPSEVGSAPLVAEDVI